MRGANRSLPMVTIFLSPSQLPSLKVSSEKPL